jgi:hypothetical protein
VKSDRWNAVCRELYGSIWIEKMSMVDIACLYSMHVQKLCICLSRLGMVWSSGLFGRNGVVTMHSLSQILVSVLVYAGTVHVLEIEGTVRVTSVLGIRRDGTWNVLDSCSLAPAAQDCLLEWLVKPFWGILLRIASEILAMNSLRIIHSWFNQWFRDDMLIFVLNCLCGGGIAC